MKKSDVMIADIALYAMKNIQMAKVDRELTGEYDYWSGEIMAMQHLLLYCDRLLGKSRKNDIKFPYLISLFVFERVGEKRKEHFDFFWTKIWEE